MMNIFNRRPTGVTTQTNATTGATELLGPGGVIPVGMGPNVLTVGASGARFSTLDDALEYRATVEHTVIASGLTGNATVGAGADVRNIALTGTPLAAFVGYKGIVGIRIGAVGQPVLRGYIYNSATLRMLAPLPATLTDVEITVYTINHVGIAILPGERIELAHSTTRYIPGHTTIFCPVKGAASMYHVGTTAGSAFISSTADNVIFKDLVLGDTNNTNGSIPFQFELPTQAEMTFLGCELLAQAQDFIYGSGSVMGQLNLIGNKIIAAFDVVNPMIFRNLNVRDNEFYMYGVEFVDGGAPTPIVLGSNSLAPTLTYPQIEAHFTGNIVHSDVMGIAASSKAVGVEIRQALPNQALVNVRANTFKIRSSGVGASSYGVLVNSAVTGSNTPTILVRDNIFDVTSAVGTANTMHSAEATYVINRQGNYTIAGTLGSNTAAIAAEV